MLQQLLPLANSLGIFGSWWWSSGQRSRLLLQRIWVRIPLSTNYLYEKTKLYEKEAGVGPLLKKVSRNECILLKKFYLTSQTPKLLKSRRKKNILFFQEHLSASKILLPCEDPGCHKALLARELHYFGPAHSLRVLCQRSPSHSKNCWREGGEAPRKMEWKVFKAQEGRVIFFPLSSINF